MNYNLKIKTPIFWNNSVGVAEHLSVYPTIRISILYKSKLTGKRLYPKPLFIKGQDILKYPVMIKKGLRLFIIPIKDLTPQKPRAIT